MKKTFFFGMMCLFSASLFLACSEKDDSNSSSGSGQEEVDGYVNLGLPSGTLWKESNEEGFITYSDAVEQFGANMPTKEQLVELYEKCEHVWTDNGYKFTGPNGKYIVLPAEGNLSCDGESVYNVGTNGNYWSSTSFNEDEAWYLRFDMYTMDVNSTAKCAGGSVRLVYKK